jgi:hypothetical protein
MKAVVASLLAVIALGACDCGLLGDCVDSVKTEVVSPDGRYVATIFERNCGATTDYSTHVALRRADEPFDPSDRARVLTVAGRAVIDVEWTAAAALSLSASLPPAKTFGKLSAWRDVQISYK